MEKGGKKGVKKMGEKKEKKGKNEKMRKMKNENGKMRKNALPAPRWSSWRPSPAMDAVLQAEVRFELRRV